MLCLVNELMLNSRKPLTEPMINSMVCWIHFNDVTWASWRLKSPSTWLFIQQLVRAKNKETSNSDLRVFCGGNPPVISGSKKRPTMRTTFPCMFWRHHICIMMPLWVVKRALSHGKHAQYLLERYLDNCVRWHSSCTTEFWHIGPFATRYLYSCLYSKTFIEFSCCVNIFVGLWPGRGALDRDHATCYGAEQPFRMIKHDGR